MEERAMENQMPSVTSVNRFKNLWRVFLIANFALGAYLFTQTGKKERQERRKHKTEAPAEVTPTPTAVDTTPVQEEPPFVPPPIAIPVIVQQPVPEDKQHELFKWMLEEKRRVKPKNREEKLKIDEEKALLKKFLRSEKVPRF